MGKQLTVQGALAQIDQIAADKDVQALLEGPPATVSEQLALAKQMTRMRQLMSKDVMSEIAALAGSELGFLTDKTYTIEQLKDPVVQALLKGYRLIGNEFNIIAGRFYAAKAGLRRKVLELDGVSDVRVVPGVPELRAGGALIDMEASWKLHGKEYQQIWRKTEQVDQRLCVRVNQGMGADAIVGKATRKVYARLYEIISGQSIEEAEEPEVLEGTVVVAEEPKQQTLLEPTAEEQAEIRERELQMGKGQ